MTASLLKKALIVVGAIVIAVGVSWGYMFWQGIKAPVPDAPCPATTREAIESRGQAFDGSFFTSQYTVNGMIVRAVRGETDPSCIFFLDALRCTAEGPVTVGARSLDEEAYFDIPESSRATIAIWSGPGIICGLEPK